MPRPVLHRIAATSLCLLVLLVTSALAAAPDPPPFMLKWGSQGAAAGQLNNPTGVATDPLGNVYVLDSSNYRVEKFDRLGNFITQWGGYGSASGQLYNVSGIAVDPAGNVFVSDGGNGRIQKFTSDGVYVSQWGTFGTGAGQFTGAGMPAVDAAGNVYVPDAHRVQKFSNAGVFITQWGSLGSANGQFNAPNAVAVDAAGFVYVADRLNQRIQKFTSTGVYVTKWSHVANLGDLAVDALGDVYVSDDASHITRYSSNGTFEIQWGSVGSASGQFSAPKSLDVDVVGNVYVADTFNHRIQKFSASGATVGEPPAVFQLAWGSLGAGNGQLSSPTDAAIDAAGNVLVTDFSNNRVERFTPTGSYLSQWGTLGSGAGQFNGPLSLGVGPDGSIYVSDGLHRVQKFTAGGAYVLEWGGPGTGNGKFDGPQGISANAAGEVYIDDTNNGRVEKFTSNGSYLLQWGSPGSGNGQFGYPRDLVVERSGNVLVMDNYNARVQRFDPSGVYLGQWGGPGSGNGQLAQPVGIALDASGNVLVVDNLNSRIQKFTSSGVYLSQWGSIGSAPGQFYDPSGIAVDAAGNIYVADGVNNRIDKFIAPPTIALVSDVGNDQGRQVRLRIQRCSADVAGSGAVITGYAVYRRVDPPPGGATASFTRGPAGREAAALAGWDYVTTMPARGDAEYEVVVPTLADANATARNYTAFFVSALTSSPTTYYDSGLESGYSIDNLSPATPVPFLGAYAAGATRLHWGASSASDFATFRLYRGTSADFVPGPANLVTATIDTAYVDAGAAGAYYKLAAVDFNGNESPYALVGPGQTTDTPSEDGALAFALDETRPNPTPGRALEARFTLPDDSPAQVELIDIAGRRIAALDVAGAGHHVVSLGRERTLRAGIYLVRLSQGVHALVRRAVVID